MLQVIGQLDVAVDDGPLDSVLAELLIGAEVEEFQ